MRAVRLIKNDKNYVLGFMKGPHLDLSGERARFAERVYDATMQLYLSSHTVDEALQREMIAIASQRVKPAQPVPPERVFDFTFTQKIILPQ